MLTTRVARRKLRNQLTLFGFVTGLTVGMLGVSNTGYAKSLQGAVQYGFEPVTSTINTVADGVGSVWSAISEIDRLRSQNDALRQENQALRNELARLPEVARLNDDWSQITQTQKSIPYRTISASVLVRDIFDADRTLLLDKGTDDGLKKGNVVIAAGGALVGRIDDIGPSTSEVLLINDVSSIVIGKAIDPNNANASADGEITGQIGGLLEMRNVDVVQTLTKGEQVVTAGYSRNEIRSIFPPALLIGHVVDVARDANAVVQTAYLEPACDFDTVQYVLVITNYTGGLLASPSPNPNASPAPSTSPRPSGSARPSASARPSTKPSPTR